MNYFKFFSLSLFISTFSISLYAANSGELTIHNPITKSNFSNYFRIKDIDDNDAATPKKPSLSDEKTTDDLITYGNSLFKADGLIKKCALKIPEPVTKKDALKVGVIAGAATLLGVTAWNKTQRSGAFEVGLATMTELGLGGMAGASIVVGLGYYLLGDEIKLITKFRGNLKKTLQELKETRDLVNELKEQQVKIEATAAHGVEVTEQMLSQFPSLKAVASDNARLASIMQMLVKQSEQQQTAIAQLITLLPEEQSSQFTDLMSQTFTEEAQQKAEALRQYNRKHFLWRKHSFSQIPHEWLTKHDFGTLIEKTEETN